MQCNCNVKGFKNHRNAKKFSLCHKLNFSTFATWWINSLMFHTEMIESNKTYSQKYLRSSYEIGFWRYRGLENQSLWQRLNSFGILKISNVWDSIKHAFIKEAIGRWLCSWLDFMRNFKWTLTVPLNIKVDKVGWIER